VLGETRFNTARASRRQCRIPSAGLRLKWRRLLIRIHASCQAQESANNQCWICRAGNHTRLRMNRQETSSININSRYPPIAVLPFAPPAEQAPQAPASGVSRRGKRVQPVSSAKSRRAVGQTMVGRRKIKTWISAAGRLATAFRSRSGARMEINAARRISPSVRLCQELRKTLSRATPGPRRRIRHNAP